MSATIRLRDEGTLKLSVVIPTYNREHEVVRAIRSCVIQCYADFEVIVVDDGSTDRSYEVAVGIGDPRLTVLRHFSNRGNNASRNTGALAASGDWIIILDSDDELLPGAFETVAAIAKTVPEDVHRIGFMYRCDDGGFSPLPKLREELVDYASYISWIEEHHRWDFLACTRRCAFENTRYPEGLWSDAALYQLDFAKRYRTLFREESVAVVHTDAQNRLSDLRRSPKCSRATAATLGKELDDLFDRHQEGLRRFGPSTFQMFRRLRAAYHFLEGNRSAGVQEILGCLRETPFVLELWGLCILGIANPGALAVVRSWRRPGR